MRRPAVVAAIGVAVALLSALAVTTGAAHPVPAHSLRTVHPARARAAITRAPVAKMIWGPLTLPSGASAFPTYRKLGVKVYEIDLDWATTAPTRPADAENPHDPAYVWPAALDTVMAQAARNHIRVCLLVQRSPGWANGHRGSAWAPNKPADYADFLIAAAHRYPSVRDWMIWGEPNRGGNFYPMPANSPVGPRRYALLLNSAYGALKSVSSRDTVIGGDTWSFGVVEPADFLRWMRLPDGRPPRLDLYGHNPFSRRFPETGQQPYFPGGRDIDDLATLESQVRHTYGRTVPLWLSEFTISSDHGNRAFDFSVTREEQARWVTAAFSVVDSYSFVVGFGWFELLDQSPPAKSALTSGLLTGSGARKPAFYAYEHAP